MVTAPGQYVLLSVTVIVPLCPADIVTVFELPPWFVFPLHDLPLACVVFAPREAPPVTLHDSGPTAFEMFMV
jgi:hypothetical protein